MSKRHDNPGRKFTFAICLNLFLCRVVKLKMRFPLGKTIPRGFKRFMDKKVALSFYKAITKNLVANDLKIF